MDVKAVGYFTEIQLLKRMLPSVFIIALVMSITWAATERINQTALEATVDFNNNTLHPSHLPGIILMSINTSKHHVPLVLRRHHDVSVDAPVYVLRGKGNRVHLKRERMKPEGSGMYHDEVNFGRFEVFHRNLGGMIYYELQGTLAMPDGLMYSLERLASPSPWWRYVLKQMEWQERRIMSALPDIGSAFGFNFETFRVKRHAKNNRYILEVKEEIYIDVMVLIHVSVYKMWYSEISGEDSTQRRMKTVRNLKRYIAHTFNDVNLRYRTIGGNIHIRLIGFIIEDKHSGVWFTENIMVRPKGFGGYADGRRFMKTIRRMKEMLSGSFPRHDHLVTYTRYPIFGLNRDGKRTRHRGFSYIGTMCRPMHSNSIIEYHRVFPYMAKLTAHEIAHSMNVHHDGHSTSSDCPGWKNYIMSDKPQDFHTVNGNLYAFSPCSKREALKFIRNILTSPNNEYLSRTLKACLLEPIHRTEVPNIATEGLGQIYPPDKQCQIVFGKDSYYQRNIRFTTNQGVCRQLYCFDPTTKVTQYFSAFPGTYCGIGQWCEHGRCVNSPYAPKHKCEDNFQRCMVWKSQGLCTKGKWVAALVKECPRSCKTC